jgi:hypothetical protein
MRLYLDLGSTNPEEILTPDWIRLEFKDGKEATYDIRGTVDFDKGGLHCRVKGVLFKWRFDYADGESIDEFNDNGELKMFEKKRFLSKLDEAATIIIGIHKETDYYEPKEADKLDPEGDGTIEFYDEKKDELLEKSFRFGWEDNDY